MVSLANNAERCRHTAGGAPSSGGWRPLPRYGYLPLIAFAVVVGLLGQDAAAQMFGQRTLGRTLSRRVGASSGDGAGTLTGRERFIRGNRSRTDFVGTDARDERSFVGRMRGRTQGNIRSGLTGFRLEEGPDVNRSAPRAGGPRIPAYPPRLKLGFHPPSTRHLAGQAARQLQQSEALGKLGRIEVWVEGETAILRGEVASAHDAELAELLARFEPGIADVQNELTIVRPQSERPSANSPQP